MKTGRGGAASLFSCARAPRVKSFPGFLTHTLRSWARSHIHKMKLRRLGQGLGLGPLGLRSHSLNQYFISAWDLDSVPVTALRVAGNSLSSSTLVKHEDPRRYLILCTDWFHLQKSVYIYLCF